MLGRIWTVALRDFNAVVRTKGFVIGLLFMPAITALSIALPKLLERFGEQGERRYAVADLTGELVAPLQEWAARRNAEPGQRLTVALEAVDLAGAGVEGEGFDAARARLEPALAERARAGQIFGWLVIGPRVTQVPPPAGDPGAAAFAADARLAYGALSLTTGELRQEVRRAAFAAARTRRLAAADVDPGLVARIDQEIGCEEFVVAKQAKPGQDGVVRSSGIKEGLMPMGVVILLLMGIMQSAGILLNATIEEKSNRVVEVLVSSVSSMELLAGKMLGSYLTGVVTLVAWGGAAAFAADHFHVLRPDTLSTANLLWYAWFFVGGYLLFGSVYLAIGSMCTSIQDAQNMMFPVILLIMLPMLGMGHVMQHPDSVLSRGLSFFPFSAPMIMPMRLAQSPPPPLWQTLISAASVAGGVWVCLWSAAKIFRIAIFSSGKPPKLGELWRWLREAS